MDILECYKLLELPVSPPLDEIRTAYKQLVQSRHSEHFKQSHQLKKKSEEELNIINSAYHQICEFMQNKETDSLLVGLSPDIVVNIKLFSSTIDKLVFEYEILGGPLFISAYHDDYRHFTFHLMANKDRNFPFATIWLGIDDTAGYKFSNNQITIASSRGWEYIPEVGERSLFRVCVAIENIAVNTLIVRETILSFCLIWNIQFLPVLDIRTRNMRDFYSNR